MDSIKPIHNKISACIRLGIRSVVMTDTTNTTNEHTSLPASDAGSESCVRTLVGSNVTVAKTPMANSIWVPWCCTVIPTRLIFFLKYKANAPGVKFLPTVCKARKWKQIPSPILKSFNKRLNVFKGLLNGWDYEIHIGRCKLHSRLNTWKVVCGMCVLWHSVCPIITNFM